MVAQLQGLMVAQLQSVMVAQLQGLMVAQLQSLMVAQLQGLMVAQACVSSDEFLWLKIFFRQVPSQSVVPVGSVF